MLVFPSSYLFPPMVANASNTSLPAKPEKKYGRLAFDMVERLKVRTMYLLMGMEGSEIAAKLECEPRQIANLIHREGWGKERKRRREKAEAAVDARAAEEVGNIVQAVAIKSEELGMASLEKAGDVLETERTEFWAKDVQALSQAAKNFVGLARQARGLDTADNLANSKTQILFVQLERVERIQKKVEEIHELNTSEITPLSLPKDNATLSPQSEDNGGF